MTNGIVFFEEYFNYLDDMSPEQYFQFMCLIRDLRFKGIDTDPNLIEDRDLRMVWRVVRPSVLKSKKNADDYKKKQEEKERQKQGQEQCAVQPLSQDEETQQQSPSDYDLTDIDSTISYLVYVDKSKGKYQREREMNDICRKNNWDFIMVLNKFNKAYSYGK